MERIRASIVVYKTEPALLLQAINSFLDSSMTGLLTVVDNSPTDDLRKYCRPDVQYIFSGKNLGYGRAHNIAMNESLNNSSYHLVINPDVYFGRDTMEKLFHFMEEHPQAGLAMPKVFDTDGRTQMMCKLLPTPLDLITRRFFPFDIWFKNLNDRYEMKEAGHDKIINVPFLSGCFMFFRTSALKQVGLFDERFFLYAEDTDLSRRMHLQFETLFFPGAEISHVHARGSYKNLWLTVCNAVSAIQYFNKWGWFFDQQRKAINERACRANNQQEQQSLREVRAA